MSARLPAWAARWRLWAPALAFFLVNVGLLLVYLTAFAGRVDRLRGAVETRAAEVGELEGRRAQLEELVARADRSREALGAFYGTRLASERERLTKVIAEVKELAGRAGLDPATISYPEEHLDDYGLVKKSFVFGVEGDYQELRRFVNFLELSPTFLALEQVSLSDAGRRATGLRINLRLAAYFRLEGEEAAPDRGEAGS